MLTRLLKISASQLLVIYAKSLLLALITILPALAFSSWKNWPTDVPFWQLVALAAISALAWTCGLFLVRHPLLPHVRLIVQQLWSKIRPASL
jgi:hypothetical protein